MYKRSSLSTTGGITTPSQPPAEIRLKTDLVPIHYDVTVRPDLYGNDPSMFSLSGTVNIALTVTKSTNMITVHYKLLIIDKSSIVVKKKGLSDIVTVTSANYEDEKDFYHITLESNLDVGEEYSVFLRYRGPLTNDLAGIYVSSYTDDNGDTQLVTININYVYAWQIICIHSSDILLKCLEDICFVLRSYRYIVASQLQATDARKVFPCFDEPSLKATFTVTIERKDPYISYCNTEIDDTTDMSVNHGYQDK